jgi:hypothetical protein
LKRSSTKALLRLRVAPGGCECIAQIERYLGDIGTERGGPHQRLDRRLGLPLRQIEHTQQMPRVEIIRPCPQCFLRPAR